MFDKVVSYVDLVDSVLLTFGDCYCWQKLIVLLCEFVNVKRKWVLFYARHMLDVSSF